MILDRIDPLLLLGRERNNGHNRINDNRAVIATLRANRLLSGLGDDWFSQLLNTGWRVTFQRDQVISQQAQPIDAIIFIVEGRARAEMCSAGNGPCKAVVGFLGPGDDIGTLCLVNGAPHSATVTAMDTVQAVHIPVEAMRSCLRNNTEWYRLLAEIAAERLSTSSAWLQRLL